MSPSRPAPPDLDLLAGGLSGPGLDRGPDSARGRLPGRALAGGLGSWAQARPADRGHRMRLPGRCLRRAGSDVEAGGRPADARLVRARPARPGRWRPGRHQRPGRRLRAPHVRPCQDSPLLPAFLDPLTDPHPPIVPAAFSKPDTVAVLTARLLPAPRRILTPIVRVGGP